MERMVIDHNGIAHKIVIQPLYGFDGAFTVHHLTQSEGVWNMVAVAGCSDYDTAENTVDRMITNLGLDPRTLN